MLRRILPERVLGLLACIKGVAKIAGARIAFWANRSVRQPLPAEMIEVLFPDYREPTKIRYDSEGLLIRADANVKRMKKWIDLESVRSALELGCGDGMVGAQLKNQTNQCWAMDLSREGFDRRASDRGVVLIQGDVRNLPFEKATFDLVFSFAAFEHFSDPARVVEESARVLHSGGFLHLEFGPIAMAPYGLHAYRSIPIPYAGVLFKQEDLLKYARGHGLSDWWPFINGAPLNEYRRIFKAARKDFHVVAYKEGWSGGAGAELIMRYPAVFRRVSEKIGDFLISGIFVCLRRR